MTAENLNVELYVGTDVNGSYATVATLAPTNGVAEEIILKKLSDKPYTWMGNVLSCCVFSIGDVEVSEGVRDSFSKNKSFTIPQVIKKLSLADVNTLIVEIQRKLWDAKLRNERMLCGACSKTLIADVDLSHIELSEKNREKVEQIRAGEPPEFLVVSLPKGFNLNWFIDRLKSSSDVAPYKDVHFNEIVFRIPTLEVCIKNEAYYDDTIAFWRRIASDSLVRINSVSIKEDGSRDEVVEFPEEHLRALGLKIFSNMDSKDLRIIRESLREELPTLGFSYKHTCPCERAMDIPHYIEASSFFSE